MGKDDGEWSERSLAELLSSQLLNLGREFVPSFSSFALDALVGVARLGISIGVGIGVGIGVVVVVVVVVMVWGRRVDTRAPDGHAA